MFICTNLTKIATDAPVKMFKIQKFYDIVIGINIDSMYYYNNM